MSNYNQLDKNLFVRVYEPVKEGVITFSDLEKEINRIHYYYQPLYDHMLSEHNVMLLESEMCDIINIVKNLKQFNLQIK